MKNKMFKRAISVILAICCIVSTLAFTNISALAASNARNKAYSKVVTSLVNQYGKAKYDDTNGAIFGVNCVELIDFNNDGKDEMLVTYTTVNEKSEEFNCVLYYRIYAFIDKKAKCVKKGIYGKGAEIGERGGVFLCYTNKGVLLVTEKSDYDFEQNKDYYYVTSYSFNGKKVKAKDKLSSLYDGKTEKSTRKINGKAASEKEFLNKKKTLLFDRFDAEKKGQIIYKKGKVKLILTDSYEKKNRSMIISRVNKNIANLK